MSQRNKRLGRIDWLRHFDIAVLILVAFAGIFLGLAHALFEIEELEKRQVAVAIVLLGALALHAILQRLTSYEFRHDLHYLRDKVDDLTSLDRARRNFVRAMGHFIEVQDLKFKLRDKNNPAFGKVADRLLAPSFSVLEALAQGHVNVPDNLVVPAFTMLLESCGERFDAVSNDDINFWHDNKTIAPRYMRQNISAIRRGLTVTRMFIVVRRQIQDDSERARLVSILTRQRFVGIAWAIAIFEDLEPSLPPGPLDFALFDSDRAVSSFRREGERRFIATFNTGDLIPANDERISDQNKLYEALLSEVLIASSLFVETFLGKNSQLLARLAFEAQLYHQRLKDTIGVAPAPTTFPFVIADSDNIAERLLEIAEVYAKYQEAQEQSAK